MLLLLLSNPSWLLLLPNHCRETATTARTMIVGDLHY
jgi:hypothetical protein